MKTLIAQSPSPSAPSLPRPSAEIWEAGGSVILSVVAGGAITKWLFGQLVETWKGRIKDLEQRSKALEDADDQARLERERTNKALESLNSVIDRIGKQLDTLGEVTRTTALLSERQNVFDQRLQNFAGALENIQRLYNESQKAFVELKGVLAVEYVRREDWLRFTNITETKLDENNRRLEDLKEIFTRAVGKHD